MNWILVINQQQLSDDVDSVIQLLLIDDHFLLYHAQCMLYSVGCSPGHSLRQRIRNYTMHVFCHTVSLYVPVELSLPVLCSHVPHNQQRP